MHLSISRIVTAALYVTGVKGWVHTECVLPAILSRIWRYRWKCAHTVQCVPVAKNDALVLFSSIPSLMISWDWAVCKADGITSFTTAGARIWRVHRGWCCRFFIMIQLISMNQQLYRPVCTPLLDRMDMRISETEYSVVCSYISG